MRWAALGFLLAAGPASLLGQGGVVSGVVYDQASKRPLGDVRVWLAPLAATRSAREQPATQAWTLPDGRFAVRAEAGRFIVRALRPGYAQIVAETVTVQAGRSAVAHLVMRPVGLPAVRVMASAAPTALEELPAPASHSPLASLAGRIAGVRVIEGGAGVREPSVLFRSPGSVVRRTDPLIVIDGVILPEGSSTVDLQPADVESIEVLKGAAAAAAYGSRGANGVVLIRTSRGRP